MAFCFPRINQQELQGFSHFVTFRDRADVLREEDPFLQSVSWSISSLGAAIGASDRRRMDGGGVEAATNSVLAHYFLKSHGGAHALQCFCSLLATLSGLGAILFQKSAFGFVLLQRTFLFAMIKHVSGLLAGASLAAKAIPKIGLAEARQWIEQLVLDPVSQYVFYTAVLLLWLPSKQRLDACWWWKQKLIPSILLVPILVREIISNILVTSDVLVLWSVGGEGASTGIETLLKVSNSIINAAMSLVVSPQVWRSADPAERQTILAKLVGRLSLAFEAAVGMVLLADLGLGFFLTAFGGSNRPPFRESLTKLLCVRLYLHFLWVRRKKIGKLAVKLRGGATQLPFWFLDVVYNPVKSMGLEISKDETSDDPSKWTWREYLPIALGLDQ